MLKSFGADLIWFDLRRSYDAKLECIVVGEEKKEERPIPTMLYRRQKGGAGCEKSRCMQCTVCIYGKTMAEMKKDREIYHL